MSRAYVVKASLKDVAPEIWRRLQVPADISLQKLHQVLQVAFGWNNYHLYLFDVAGTHYSDPDSELDLEIEDTARVTFRSVAPWVGSSFSYIYDFGDDWQHQIVLEQVLEVDDPQGPAFFCLGGERACPPEDCGGVPGYEEILKALRAGKGKGYQETRRWVGKDFDPDLFDREAINAGLRLLA